MNMKTRMKNMMAVLMAAGLMVACDPFDSWEDNPTDEVIDLTSLQITCEGIDDACRCYRPGDGVHVE